MENPGRVRLMGQKMSISLHQTEQIPLLWKKFKTSLSMNKLLNNRRFFSVSLYGNALAEGSFGPDTEFEKWAATPILKGDELPEGNEILEIEAGLYAVFLHRGLPGDFPKTADFIFNHWLPGSDYQLDSRPHFEIMDENYRINDPDPEEEIWIPVRPKK